MSRVLFFIHSLAGGGAERVTASLANHWAANGWEIAIVTLASRSLDAYPLHPHIVRFELGRAVASGGSLRGLWMNPARIRALRRVLRVYQPGVAVAMMSSANIVLAIAARGVNGVRPIGSERIHPPQMPLTPVWERLRKWSYKWLFAVVALTDESAHWLARETCARRVRVIPNAASWPLPDAHTNLTPPPPDDGRKILLAVGRFQGQKNFSLLIDVFARLAALHHDWDLAIVGDGPGRETLEAQVRAMDLATRVRMPGFAGNIAAWYGRADVFVLSSRFEGFPNALAEAMAHGLPAVAFDCPTGPRDIVRHGVDGLLVTANDADELHASLDRLMSDAATRNQFAQRALEVRERFAMPAIVSLWECLFAESGA